RGGRAKGPERRRQRRSQRGGPRPWPHRLRPWRPPPASAPAREGARPARDAAEAEPRRDARSDEATIAHATPRGVAQLAEHRSPKPGVAGSSPAAPVALGKRKQAFQQEVWNV